MAEVGRRGDEFSPIPSALLDQITLRRVCSTHASWHTENVPSHDKRIFLGHCEASPWRARSCPCWAGIAGGHFGCAVPAPRSVPCSSGTAGGGGRGAAIGCELPAPPIAVPGIAPAGQTKDTRGRMRGRHASHNDARAPTGPSHARESYPPPVSRPGCDGDVACPCIVAHPGILRLFRCVRLCARSRRRTERTPTDAPPSCSPRTPPNPETTRPKPPPFSPETAAVFGTKPA